MPQREPAQCNAVNLSQPRLNVAAIIHFDTAREKVVTGQTAVDYTEESVVNIAGRTGVPNRNLSGQGLAP